METQDSEIKETLPRIFEVRFKEKIQNGKRAVQVLLDKNQVGDIIDDNSYEEDFYRYHDVFHYTFATYLDWSPCMRAMLKRKRKSIPEIDEYEDGARATITEEAISLILFNEAKRTDYFKDQRIDPNILRIIKQMTEPFEVRDKSLREWETAILKGYELFRLLLLYNGGVIKFNAANRTAKFCA